MGLQLATRACRQSRGLVSSLGSRRMTRTLRSAAAHFEAQRSSIALVLGQSALCPRFAVPLQHALQVGRRCPAPRTRPKRSLPLTPQASHPHTPYLTQVATSSSRKSIALSQVATSAATVAALSHATTEKPNSERSGSIPSTPNGVTASLFWSRPASSGERHDIARAAFSSLHVREDPSHGTMSDRAKSCGGKGTRASGCKLGPLFGGLPLGRPLGGFASALEGSSRMASARPTSSATTIGAASIRPATCPPGGPPSLISTGSGGAPSASSPLRGSSSGLESGNSSGSSSSDSASRSDMTRARAFATSAQNT